MNTKKLTEKQADRITAALTALGVYKYECKSCYDKRNAQLNLDGRTHYVEDDTLRYFKGRINRAFIPGQHGTGKGLLFCIYESVGNKPDAGNKNKRATVFDAFGTVVFQSDFYRTTDQAAEAFHKWFDEFDLRGHYEARIRGKIKRMRREATAAAKALRGEK